MKVIILILTVLLSIQISAQESSKRSGKVKVNLEKAFRYPPQIEYEINFIDPSGNGQLDAEERCKIEVKFKNSGQGIAKGLRIDIEPSSIKDLSFDPVIKAGDIPSGSSKVIDIYISASLSVETNPVTLTLKFAEERGFEPLPAKVNFSTKSFDPPQLIISDEIAINDASGNNKIEQGELVSLKVVLYNSGIGMAKDVKAKIEYGENVFPGPNSTSTFDLGEIKRGEYKEINFAVITNMRASEIPVFVTVTESYQKYGIKRHQVPLTLNKIYAGFNEINIEKKVSELTELNEPKFFINELQENIPELGLENKDAIAVIIGNRDYHRKDIPSVDFAIRDASLAKEYISKMFGYKEENIILIENASQSDFNSMFGTVNNHKGRLFNLVKEGKSDVFIYYSGHGAPDPESRQGYFVPVDCDPSLVALNGYSLNTFNENLSRIKYKSLTVVIDACFSGSSDKGTLLKNISPVFIQVDNPLISGDNTTVFTSANGDQVSSWYPEKRHSLFTYYFLKGLKGEADLNNDRVLTTGEMKQYILDNVPYMARRLNNREQTPQVIGEDSEVLVKY